jgi:catechol 2,3-dioxygenase-like lactoylglutathione lyase family enzyme
LPPSTTRLATASSRTPRPGGLYVRCSRADRLEAISDAATSLELQGEGTVEGRWVDRIVALDGVHVEYAFMQTPDGHGRLELIKFNSPSTQGGNRHAPANTPGIRHVAFAVEDIDAVVACLRARGAELVGELVRYEDSYRLCYVRGPEGIIVELAERIG